METIFFLLPLVLALAVVAVVAFFWALKNGQFDDLKTPAMRVLFEDEKATKATTPKGPGGKADTSEQNKDEVA